MTVTANLEARLSNIGLYYLAKNHADFCARLTKKKLSGYQTIELLADLEHKERLDRGILKRVKGASLGRFKPYQEFDWAWPKKIDRDVIEHLMTLAFVDEPANVVLFGTSGVGKTMIAKNIGYQAAMQGHSVLFTEASEMLSDLERQESPRLLKQRLAKYTRPRVLIIDEVGYLSYSNKAADLLFQVITKRHETGSTVITTNVSFKEWSTIFPGAGCLVAMLDRLTHRAELTSIEADSYRRKESKERKKIKPPAKAETAKP